MFNAFLRTPWIGVGVGIFLQVHSLLYLLSEKISLPISLNEIPIIWKVVPIVGGLPLPFFPNPIVMPLEQWVGSVVLVAVMLFLVPQFVFGEGKRQKPRLWDFCWSGFLAILLFYKVH